MTRTRITTTDLLSQNEYDESLTLYQRMMRAAKRRAKYIAASGAGLLAGGCVTVALIMSVPGLTLATASVGAFLLIAAGAIGAAALVTGLVLAAYSWLECLVDEDVVIVSSLNLSPEPSAPKPSTESLSEQLGNVATMSSGPGVESSKSQPKSQSALQPFSVFPSVESVVLVEATDMVCLKDDSSVSKEKVEAIFSKLKSVESNALLANKAESFHFLLTVCQATSKENRDFYLGIHSSELAIFRAKEAAEDKRYPLISSNNTIDDETCRVIACSLVRDSQQNFAIENPVKVAFEYKR